MANLNKIMLMGRLGKDPEMRYTAEGTAVASFSLATSESYKDRSGTKQEKTEWHNIVAWRRLAEIAGEYLKKGKLVYIEGKIQSREYDAKDGTKRKVFEILATDLKMLPSGQVQGQGNEQKQGGYNHNRPDHSSYDDFVPEEDDVPM